MTVRIGFLGAGLIATFHSKMLRASGVDHVRTGVYDPDGARAAAFVAAAGGTVAATEDEVLDDCDAVYICTWTSEHPRLLDKAVDRGLAVFCEKPLGVDLASARAMAERAANATAQVGLVLRYSPAFALLESLLDDPRSGRLLSLTMRDDQHLPTQGRYGSTWRGDVTRAGAGVLLEHSIHDVDLLERLAGRITSVSARSAFVHGIEGIEDVVHLTAVAESGTMIGLTTVWHDHLDRPGNRYLEAHCERALFTVTDDWFGPVTWQYSGGDTGAAEGDTLLDMVAAQGRPMENPDGAFVTAATAGTPAWPDFTVALRAHELVDAAYRSCADGGTPVAT